MAIYTFKEFADLCGVSIANLSTYKSRGKVVVDANNRVNDQEGVNAEFLARQLSKKGKSVSIPAAKSPEVAEQIADAKRNLPLSDGQPASKSELLQLEKKKKQLDIEKTREEIELLRKKNEKMDGDLLPTDMVKSLIVIHFSSASNAFHASIDKILTEWVAKKGFTRTEVAEIRGAMRKHLNKAIDDSVKESKLKVQQLVEETAVKKGVGERK